VSLEHIDHVVVIAHALPFVASSHQPTACGFLKTSTAGTGSDGNGGKRRVAISVYNVSARSS